jgi:hypothetical protein
MDKVRRFVVTFAATTVCKTLLKVKTERFVTFVECFVTFNVAKLALTVETDGDRHSFFCFFFCRPPEALPALSVMLEESVLSFVIVGRFALHCCNRALQLRLLRFKVCAFLFVWGRAFGLVFLSRIHHRLLVTIRHFLPVGVIAGPNATVGHMNTLALGTQASGRSAPTTTIGTNFTFGRQDLNAF